MYFEYQEVILLQRLNTFFHMDHNIFLVDSVAERDHIITTSHQSDVITPRSVYRYKIVGDKITGVESLTKISSKNTFLIVVAIEANTELLNEIKRIQLLQINVKVGVFFVKDVSTENLLQLFKWFWESQIINIFVGFHTDDNNVNGSSTSSSSSSYSLNVYTFNPFGTFSLINVTGSTSFENYFLRQNSNLQRYPFRLGYLFSDISNDERVWHAIFNVMNATFTVIHGPEFNWNSIPRTELFKLVAVDVIRTTFNMNDLKQLNMYPVHADDQVILVPEALPYSQFSSYLRTVTSDPFFGYSYFTIVLVIILLTLFRYVRMKKMLFFQTAADVVNLLMNDNAAIKYRQLGRNEVMIIVPLTLAGLVIVNGVISALQSYLTKPVNQPQINSFEDIYDSPYPILTDKVGWRGHMIKSMEDLSKHGNWDAKVLLENRARHIENIARFNRSFAFILPDTLGKVIIDLQKRKNVKKGYHIMNVHIYKYLSTYAVRDDFPFTERFNEIIHWIQNAGLYEKWWKDELHDSCERIYRYFNNGTVMASDDDDIDRSPMPMFIVYGWFASVIVFIFEIMWKNTLRNYYVTIKKCILRHRYLRCW